MEPVNEKPLRRTSVCTHIEPKIASIVQKFTPSVFLSLASDKFLYTEKEFEIKSEP